MSEENLILKNWLQQQKVFIDNLIISRNRPTKDSVHDLRVAVKKMRSYLRLNEEFTKENWRGPFSRVRDLFRCFGKLRDYDMSLELCRKLERKWQIALPAFKEYLCVNRSLTRRWAKQAANKFDKEQPVFGFPFGFFNGLDENEASSRIIALSIEKTKRAKRLKRHFNKNAHEIRKQLKDVLYWLKVCPKQRLENLLDVKHLDATLKYLGIWQDQYIFRRKIRQYSRELASENELNVFDELEKKIIENQKELLAKAEKKLSQLENKKATTIKRSLLVGATDPDESNGK